MNNLVNKDSMLNIQDSSILTDYVFVSSRLDDKELSDYLFDSGYYKPKALLKTIASYTLDRKNSRVNIADIVDQASKLYDYIFFDSGGYQSKTGKLHKKNINKHIDTYYKLLEIVKKYDNVYVFSLDFPPCRPDKFHSDAITPEESSKYTEETYTHIANYADRQKTIIVAHYAHSIVFKGWYNIFEKLQDKLREFEYFATGILTKHKNSKYMSFYTGAKKFLELFDIYPKKFHFLGTATPHLLYPLYNDDTVEIKTYDKTVTAYYMTISLPIRIRNSDKIKIKNIDVTSLDLILFKNAFDVLKEYEPQIDYDYIYKTFVNKVNRKRQDMELVYLIRKLDVLIMMLIGQWLKENRLVVSLDYNLETEKSVLEEKMTYDKMLKILQRYFDNL